MTPPGLTCVRCERPLTPRLARATDEGYRHADKCPRPCAVGDCDHTRHARGYCRKHYGELVEGRRPRTFDPVGRLEDICWMAETGESLAGVAKRLNITERAVALFLTRHKQTDVLAALTRRNPRDPNNRTNLALLGDWG